MNVEHVCHVNLSLHCAEFWINSETKRNKTYQAFKQKYSIRLNRTRDATGLVFENTINVHRFAFQYFFKTSRHSTSNACMLHGTRCICSICSRDLQHTLTQHIMLQLDNINRKTFLSRYQHFESRLHHLCFLIRSLPLPLAWLAHIRVDNNPNINIRCTRKTSKMRSFAPRYHHHESERKIDETKSG